MGSHDAEKTSSNLFYVETKRGLIEYFIIDLRLKEINLIQVDESCT